ncbi:MAG TPA: DNA mismatch repair endonuclease MutL, partial [Phnomibacter sp.]|nr:DNA mismatch repair endonuclease MutL [Phnomibacter sp.]
AMAFPDIHFSFTSNGQQVFFLEKGSQKQRIVQLLGGQYNAKLVPVQEETSYLTIRGFVGKPDTARKTRGDQYIFANNRFIRSAYLNHAIISAFADLIPKDSFPGYVLFLDLDPTEIDINVHPTKQEIKFTDEKIVYAFVQAAVKHALAQFSIAPSLDFTLDPEIQSLEAIQQPQTEEKRSQVAASSLYRTFTQKGQAHLIEPSGPQPWKEMKHQNEEIREQLAKGKLAAGKTGTDEADADHGWKSELAKLKEQFLTPSEKSALLDLEHEQRPISRDQRFTWLSEAPLMQLHFTYIVGVSNQGHMIVHQQYAHERIIYERLQKAIFGKPIATQQSLFPVTFSLQQADTVMLQELLPEMKQLGYHIEPFGANSFVIQGTPADVETGNEQKAIELLLDQYKHFSGEVKFSKREKLIRSLAWQQSIKPGRSLGEKEMRNLLEQLFLCSIPNATPGGKPTYVSYRLQDLDKIFG